MEAKMASANNQTLDLDLMAANAAEAEALLKELANRNRLMILCSLVDEELCVGELNAAVPLSQSALSQHLKRLRAAGLVQTRRDGQAIYYRLTSGRVADLLSTLHGLFCDPAEGHQA